MSHSHHIFGLTGCHVMRDGKSGDGTESQEETNEQVAGESEGGQSPVLLASGNANVGGVGVSGQGGIGHQSGGVGDTDITTISTSDPEVTLAALDANQNVTGQALSTVDQSLSLANGSLQDLESVATSSIEAGVDTTALNDQFGEAALQSAADSEANNTTALEAMGTETQQNAANALAAAQNETLAGVTPAQEFQTVGAGGAAGTIFGYSVNTIATWLTIAVAVISLAYWLKHRKPA